LGILSLGDLDSGLSTKLLEWGVASFVDKAISGLSTNDHATSDESHEANKEGADNEWESDEWILAFSSTASEDSNHQTDDASTHGQESNSSILSDGERCFILSLTNFTSFHSTP
jgi:hypothetical protein